MYKICYIVPYFGKLPQNFQLWLYSCYKNPTIDWLILSNDKTNYNYPSNVKFINCEFNDIVNLIKSYYNFEIKINSYWELSLFKPAYGEIFQKYIKEYDFWGHCDIDLLWGNIRKFLTDSLLTKYDKIGFQGHSTLYRNNEEVNSRYKIKVPNEINYIDVFSGQIRYSFDENGMETIYKYLKIPYYKETNFAHLSKYDYSFVLKYLPENCYYKNRRQIFLWEDGTLNRYYVEKNRKEIEKEEFMYIHFFCRPISYKYDNDKMCEKYIIYPDVVKEFNDKKVTLKLLNKYGKNSKIKYYIKSIYYNRKKLTLKKIKENIIRMIKHKKENLY